MTVANAESMVRKNEHVKRLAGLVVAAESQSHEHDCGKVQEKEA